MTLSSDFKAYPKNRKGQYLFGVEIETSDSNVPSERFKFVKGTEFICKSDISIHGNNPIEFVSLPLPEYRLKIKVKKLYQLVAPIVNDSCGLHVHISKSICTNQTVIANLRLAFRYMRDSDYFAIAGRGQNTYCSAYDHTRYQPVNTENSATYELRIFAASDTYQWVNRCIDVTRAIFQYRQPQDKSWFLGFKDYFEKRFKYNFVDVRP